MVLRLLQFTHRLVFVLVYFALARATYYMDDTNSSFVYTGPSAKWSRITPNNESWVDNPQIYFATLTHSVCETADNCSVMIPFTGSGLTIYGVLRSSVTVGITIDGKSSTYNFADDNSCLNDQKFGCPNSTIYDAQFLPYDNYNVTVSMFSVPQSARNFLYSDFYLDYVAVNQTRTDVTSPAPSISPSPTGLPSPTDSSPTNSRTGTANPPGPSGTPTIREHPPRGTIAGIVLGLIFGIACICGLMYCAAMRCRRRDTKTTPIMRPPPGSHIPSQQLERKNSTTTTEEKAHREVAPLLTARGASGNLLANADSLSVTTSGTMSP